MSFDEGTLAAWWAVQIPHLDEWTSYLGIVRWVRQPLRPSVEMFIPFPDELFSSDYAAIWAEALYQGYDPKTTTAG